MSVRTRIAPSPTGEPHVGTPYMALFNWIFARSQGGQFILRIEDTDRTRSRTEYEHDIFRALKWINIDWDEGPDIGGSFGPYRQSERSDIYRSHCEELIKKGKAYKCFATPKELEEMRELSRAKGDRIGYDRRYRSLTEEEVQAREERGEPYVVRLKVPLSGNCSYEDGVKGHISTPWADIDDQILLKSDGFPTYHLANVVDDHLMKITHVLRGDEWISSTPKHLLLYEAFGWTPPQFFHLPLLLGTDGKKLSKRKNPTSVDYYRESGYLSEAFSNFLTLMGYSMPGDKEIYTIDEIVKSFDPKRIGLSGAIFDVRKLDWLNQQYLINSVPENELWGRIAEWGFNEKFIQKLMPLCHTRIKTFGDFMELCQFLFINHLSYTDELFAPKKIEKKLAASILQCLIWSLDEEENWGRSGIEAASQKAAKCFGLNHKKVIIPLLYASITGKDKGPPLYDSFELLGKARARARLLQSIDFLGGLSKKSLSLLEKLWKQEDCSSLIEESKSNM